MTTARSLLDCIPIGNPKVFAAETRLFLPLPCQADTNGNVILDWDGQSFGGSILKSESVAGIVPVNVMSSPWPAS